MNTTAADRSKLNSRSNQTAYLNLQDTFSAKGLSSTRSKALSSKIKFAPSAETFVQTFRWPRSIFDQIFAFAPNRDTLGGTAYLIVGNSADIPTNLLIDAPDWNEETQDFLQQQGGVQRLFLTHRGGHGKAREIQKMFGCEIVVQEQEAYLLPNLEVTRFEREMQVSNFARALWTPGHSPGSACLHWNDQGGILFSGRHLLPTAQGDPAPLRTPKTFHWPRQIQSTRRILAEFSPQSLAFICPGASSGYLRGKGSIDRAYDRLAQLDLDALQQTKVLL